MDSDGARFVLSGVEELGDNIIRWGRSVQEVQIHVFDTLLGELCLLVLGLVEPHNKRDSHALENRHVVIRGEGAVPVCYIQGARKSHELSRYNPIEIAILNLLEVLVLLHIEGAVVVPSKGHSELKTLEAVVVSAAVSAIAHRCVTVGNKLVVVGTEGLPGLISGLLKHNDHEGTHKEGSVALLRVLERCVVVDFVVLVLLVIH